MIKKFTEDIQTDIYIKTAGELGYNYEIMDPEYSHVKIYNGDKAIYLKTYITSLNDSAATSFALDKHLTIKTLKKFGLPVPEQKLFKIKDHEEILEYAKDKFPIVVKPKRGEGGHGVFVNISDIPTLENALSEIGQMREKLILVEEFIKGTDFRIILFDNEILDAIERIKAYIIGDGNRNIQELIEEKNITRNKLRVKEIKIDKKTEIVLAKSNYNLGAIPPKNERVTLKENCNFSEGGETKRINLGLIHEDNINVFKKISEISRLRLCAIDFISSDITKSYKEVGSVINEINSAPSMDVHYFADFGNDITVAKKILAKALG